MKIIWKQTDPAGVKAPALIVFLFSEDKADLKDRPELSGLKQVIGPRLKAGDFSAKHLATLTLFPELPAGPQRILLVGLGAAKDFKLEKFRTAAAKGLQASRDLGVKSAALVLPPVPENQALPAALAETAALGARLGQYEFGELKTSDNDKKKPVEAVTIVSAEGQGRTGIKAALDFAEITADSIALARDLVNRPANMVYPETLAEEAVRLGGEHGFKVSVLDVAAAGKKSMGAFLGVAQGSERPGRIIVLEYKGGQAKAKPLALVGKAITFDSGGLCLKPPDSMSTMKTDMAGGAAVLAAVTGAARLKLKVNIVGVIPAAENMPDGRSYRPGDVLKSMSGQTIEVTNTDAEGRLILADALTLAREFKPTSIIDLATLTGACVVALGEKCAGLLSTDPALVEGLKEAGQKAGEMVWELPLIEDYFENLKSEVADFKNSGGRTGGTILGGLFLKKFVGDTPWAHVDIAGPARSDKAVPGSPSGATGFGVNLLLQYLRAL